MIDINALYPVLVADNLLALKVFYQTYFGFDAVYFEDGFYLHLVHPGNGTELGFLAPGLDSQPAFLHIHPSKEGMVTTFEVVDAKAAYAVAQREGLDIAMAYKEEAWGQNHFMLRDPEGFIVDIVQHLR